MTIKVLLVDDSPLITTMLKTILETNGLEVKTASNGVEAIFALYHQNPDLVFLDIMLPDISGYMLSRLIKEDPRTMEIPVILLSGKEERNTRFWGMEAGADFYMSKENCKPKGILEIVEQILQKFPTREKKHLVQSLEPPDMLAHICSLLLPKLDELTIHQRFNHLDDLQLLLTSLFDLLSYFMEFNSGIFFFPKSHTMYQYTNLPAASSFFQRMQQYILQEGDAPPATVMLDSFYLLKQCRVLKEDDQILAEMEKKGEALSKQELKSFFLQPIYKGEEKVAVLMLGSFQENLIEAGIISHLDSFIPLITTMVITSRLFGRYPSTL